MIQRMKLEGVMYPSLEKMMRLQRKAEKRRKTEEKREEDNKETGTICPKCGESGAETDSMDPSAEWVCALCSSSVSVVHEPG